VELVYIDDVIAEFLKCCTAAPTSVVEYREVPRYNRVTLGYLAALIRSFRDSRRSLVLPSFDDEFVRRLYVTYLSYLEATDFSYSLQQRTDARGTLAEFMKSPPFGQIFVSRTSPGVTRGNHYHHSKAEKFLVVEGDAVVRFRQVLRGEIIEHRVSGQTFRVVDIPPGYVHSIENVGERELVTLFWSSEVFDPQHPDTIASPVLPS
jgi:UDP-2-acetamido-2,6-beta-L-arabino-hexul-4-ose reductase